MQHEWVLKNMVLNNSENIWCIKYETRKYRLRFSQEHMQMVGYEGGEEWG